MAFRFKSFQTFSFILIISIILTACEKDPSPPELVPDGGTISGVFNNQSQNTTDTFLIEPLSGRFTTNEGFSFVASNDKFTLYFYLPQTSGTGEYQLADERDYYFQLIIDGDTINGQQSSLNVHLDLYEEHRKYTLVSGRFTAEGVFYGQGGSNHIQIEDGTFENIPISSQADEGNYVFYKGERIAIDSSKAFISDRQRLFEFNIPDKTIHVSHPVSKNNYASRTLFSGGGGDLSDLVLSNLNPSQKKVSGSLTVRSYFDLEVHFKDVSYDVFPVLEDGEMVLFYNFGEEILYFHDVKYIVNQTASIDRIEATIGSNQIELFTVFNLDAPNATEGTVVAENSNFLFIPSDFDSYGFVNRSTSNSVANFETMHGITGMDTFGPISILGKNIPVEM